MIALHLHCISQKHLQTEADVLMHTVNTTLVSRGVLF